MIGEAPELFLEFRIDAAQFSESNHERLVELELAEVADIGAKRVCQNEGIEAVVFGASHGMTVPEAVELLGIDREDVKP